MERRAFLGASTAALLAGCGDTQSEVENPVDNESNETEPAPEDAEPQVEGDAEVAIQNSRWIEGETAVEF